MMNLQDEQHIVPWTIRDSFYGLMLVIGGLFLLVISMNLVDNLTNISSHLKPLIKSLSLFMLPVLMLLSTWMFGVRKYGVSCTYLGFTPVKFRYHIFFLPCIALLLGSAFGGFYKSISAILEIPSLIPPEVPTGIIGDGYYRIINVGFIGVLGPIAEEIFFRGFVLTSLIRPLGNTRAIVVESAIFSISHMSIGVLIPIFVSGLILSYLYLKTSSIWPSSIAHIAQNLIAISPYLKIG